MAVKFDSNFQLKVLANLLKDEQYYLRVVGSLPTTFFEVEAHQWIYDFAKTYYNTYSELPKNDILFDANNILNPDVVNNKENINKQLIAVAIKQIDQIDIDAWIQNASKDFLVEKIYTEAIVKCIDHLENKRFDLIEYEINSAMSLAKEGETIAYDYFDADNIDKRLTHQLIDRTPTGWDLIDVNIKRGLANGQLGVIMAPTGVGKSFALVNIAYGAMLQKKNVVYFTLELPAEDISNRLDAIITETSLNKIHDDKISVIEKINKHKEELGNFYVVDMREKRFLNDIKVKLIQMKSLYNIDTIIIDYAGVIKPPRGSKEKRWDMETTFENLTFLAKEFLVKAWTASQTNRCCDINTIVDIKNKGKIKIIDANIGDEVFTHNGYKSIVDKCVQTQPMYKIKLKSGKEIIVSANHVFPTGDGTFKAIESGLNVGDKLLINKSESLT